MLEDVAGSMKFVCKSVMWDSLCTSGGKIGSFRVEGAKSGTGVLSCLLAMIESSLSDMDLRKASWLSMADADGAKDSRSGVKGILLSWVFS